MMKKILMVIIVLLLCGTVFATNTTAIINNFFMIVLLSSLGVQNLFYLECEIYFANSKMNLALLSNLKFVLLHSNFLILEFFNIPGTRKMYLGYLVCKFSLLVIHYFPRPWPRP